MDYTAFERNQGVPGGTYTLTSSMMDPALTPVDTYVSDVAGVLPMGHVLTVGVGGDGRDIVVAERGAGVIVM